MVKLLLGFIILLIFFGVIETNFPLHKQNFFRSGWWTDVAHFFVNQILVQIGVYVLAVILYILVGWWAILFG